MVTYLLSSAIPLLVNPSDGHVHNITVRQFHKITLNCTFKVTQPAQVTWLIPLDATSAEKENSTYINPNENPNSITQISTSITFWNVTQNIRGTFTCKTINMLGTAMATFWVTGKCLFESHSSKAYPKILPKSE